MQTVTARSTRPANQSSSNPSVLFHLSDRTDRTALTTAANGPGRASPLSHPMLSREHPLGSKPYPGRSSRIAELPQLHFATAVLKGFGPMPLSASIQARSRGFVMAITSSSANNEVMHNVPTGPRFFPGPSSHPLCSPMQGTVPSRSEDILFLSLRRNVDLRQAP